MVFKKGNTAWKNSKEFVANHGRMTSEVRKEMEPKRKAAVARYAQRRAMKDDMFYDITKSGGVQKAMDKVVQLAEKGDVRPMIELIKILTPKDVDITSGGEKVQMGSVTVDGSELSLTIGDEVKKED